MPPIVRILPLYLLVYLKRLGVTAGGESQQEGHFMIVAGSDGEKAMRGNPALTHGVRRDRVCIERSDGGHGRWIF
jgi:hypothetical protein